MQVQCSVETQISKIICQQTFGLSNIRVVSSHCLSFKCTQHFKENPHKLLGKTCFNFTHLGMDH